MTIRVALNHKTQYIFDRPVSLSPHEVRLRPAAHCRTPINSYSLKILPKTHFINWQQDPYGNFIARLVFPEKSRELVVEIDLIADMTVINPFDFFVEEYADKFPFDYPELLNGELRPFLETGPQGPHFEAWLEGIKRDLIIPDIITVDFLVAINQRTWKDIRYLIRMEPGVQDPEVTLEHRSGSCRDSAWLLVHALRRLGLAARFASGYLIQLTADQKALDGPSGPEADFTDLHAWTEVYIPGAGWVGLDPTSGLMAGEGHIPLACTALPTSAAPVTGFTDVCTADFHFHMTVQRVHEDPRVTRPYTDEQWAAIESLGHQVDAELTANDVRLTMGGEPTFISIDDMDGLEWTFAALGPTKRTLAGQLVRRLRNRFATGGLLQYTQGKWYPGEPLPRWALNCYWRVDKVPLWRNPELLGDDRNLGYTPVEAKRFAALLATKLGLPGEALIPAYEDALHYIKEEANLPVKIDFQKIDLKDADERARLAKLLEQGLNQPVGFALPLRPAPGAWVTSPWPLRRGHLYLIPGDSPMGLRLPMDSLPWVAPADWYFDPPRDPFDTRQALHDPNARPLRGQRYQGVPHALRVGLKAGDVVRTTLCVQARDGILYVFLPPLSQLEDFVDLIAVIEATATELAMPIILEGYDPPRDPRLMKFAVTPDPGVIEVNIHPAHSWDELVSNTTALYEDARQARLASEKFMVDGRHIGTGGGNHVTIGAATADDSPMLRRPDLLRSLISYWQNHPALSYLFSGQFIGPTSQAPRVDEARDDNLYELETAFQQMSLYQAQHGSPPPWLVDRLLRNLLVDLTGNTHRAEFSIDKLYSPDSVTGRLGLVEFRAFEMPPHARMSLAQMLLLRALIARFWTTPYQGRLISWGTELHDRFLLPHFVAQDFTDVVLDLKGSGYPFEFAWYAPFFEFRFPRYGTVNYDGVSIELRQAIEPWHVLGEEITTGGTARYVDSSVERMQVKVNGMVEGRHIVTCNGRPLPLHPTGTRGEYVAGVRYKAWAPPSALHPTIGMHGPLVFDLIDTWSGRALGGCTYHVAHPGGRNYVTFPINANEAEARRFARFLPIGHTPGPITVPSEGLNRDFPFTLDLRRAPEGKLG